MMRDVMKCFAGFRYGNKRSEPHPFGTDTGKGIKVKT
jgi:hypothetical protein